MVEVAFAIPGDIKTRTGGYSYDREVLTRLPHFGVAARHLPLPGGYPSPSAEDLQATSEAFASLPDDTVVIIDGLAFGAMPRDLIASIRQRIIALVHHPLGYESGLSPERAEALIQSEREALTLARRVIVTSPLTKRLLVDAFDVPSGSITVAVPGTTPATRVQGNGNPLHLLSIGSVSPRKGFEYLVEALAPLQDRDWTLTIAGSLKRDPDAARKLKAAIAQRELSSRIKLPGELGAQALAKLYTSADVFVLPSLFEGYGMVLAEAMVRGLPIVCTTGGAAAETVPDAAALKVPPGEAKPLTEALDQIITDASLRQKMSDAAWKAGQRLPDWRDTALYTIAVIREVAK